MRFRPLATVFGIVFAAASPALADEDRGTIYGNLRVTGSAAEASATGAGTDSGEIAGVAGVLGYSFGRFPLRAEVEVARRFRFDFAVQDGVAPVAERESNPATTAALASAIVEWRNDTDFTPFAGVTAGWAWNSTDTDRMNLSATAPVPASSSAGDDADTDNFAYGGVLGLDWGLGESWSAEVAYRYLNLGGAETGTAGAADSVSADEFVSHDVLLSIFYRF